MSESRELKPVQGFVQTFAEHVKPSSLSDLVGQYVETTARDGLLVVAITSVRVGEREIDGKSRRGLILDGLAAEVEPADEWPGAGVADRLLATYNAQRWAERSQLVEPGIEGGPFTVTQPALAEDDVTAARLYADTLALLSGAYGLAECRVQETGFADGEHGRVWFLRGEAKLHRPADQSMVVIDERQPAAVAR